MWVVADILAIINTISATGMANHTGLAAATAFGVFVTLLHGGDAFLYHRNGPGNRHRSNGDDVAI